MPIDASKQSYSARSVSKSSRNSSHNSGSDSDSSFSVSAEESFLVLSQDNALRNDEQNTRVKPGKHQTIKESRFKTISDAMLPIRSLTSFSKNVAFKSQKNTKNRTNKLANTFSKRLDTMREIEDSIKDIPEHKQKNVPLKLEFSFFDYLSAYFPDFIYDSPKKRILKNGMDLINQKLDIKSYINALNELEKLKVLLFDETQNCLFEHIPKPVLVDKQLMFKSDEKSQQARDEEEGKDEELGETERSLNTLEDVDFEEGENTGKKKKKVVDTIMAFDAQFWARKTKDQKAKNFRKALEHVREREIDGDGQLNIIDQRLLQVLDNFQTSD